MSCALCNQPATAALWGHGDGWVDVCARHYAELLLGVDESGLLWELSATAGNS